MKNISVIIVAAGHGIRAGSELPKQFVAVGGRPLLMHTVEAFDKKCDRIIVVLPSAYIAQWEQLCQDHDFRTPHTLCEGGDERFTSVRNGIEKLSPDTKIILVHDGVRPFVSSELIDRVIEATKEIGAVVPSTPVTDTLRRIGGGSVSRSEVMAVQTPQGFDADILRRAYNQPFNKSFTDDASVVEAAGYAVEMTEGEVENMKITTPYDLKIANILLTIK